MASKTAKTNSRIQPTKVEKSTYNRLAENIKKLPKNLKL